MLIIPIKEGEQIDRVLKRYKKKVRKVKQLRTLRNNKFYTKKSEKRRKEIANAKYREEFLRSKEF